MSNFVVSARKYRPQRFDDVVGQQHVAGTLKNALATDHLAHAFLFTGPRGVGKTTCARILAKIINCENRTADHEACEVCSSCKAFNDNASFNIIELDAASNNGVEHIRAIVEQVRFTPQQGKYKVFIIDEVHMLSAGAFNAFLKTLEEPPPYAIFILATTEKHKIIPTILSRCQIFDFRRITVHDMVLHLRGICDKEGIKAEDDALHIIAQKADGALRDALSIFDRITSFSGKNIRYDDVIENLNVLDYDYFFQITDALMAEDVPAILQLFDQILRKGFEPEVFVLGLAEHLRNILVCKDEATLSLLEVGESLRERYRKQAALAPATFLLTALNLANDCDINFKMARNKRLHVEISLIKMGYIHRAIKAARSPAAAAPLEKKTPDLTSAPDPSAPPPPIPLPSNASPLGKDAVLELKAGLRLGQKKAETISLSLDAYDTAVATEDLHKAALESRLNHENASAEWNQYATGVESPTLRQAMQLAKLKLEEKVLTVTVGMSTHRGLLMQEMGRLLDILQKNLHDPAVRLRIELDEAQLESLKPPAPKRPTTVREKIDNMKEVNPHVADLLLRFDLRPEE